MFRLRIDSVGNVGQLCYYFGSRQPPTFATAITQHASQESSLTTEVTDRALTHLLHLAQVGNLSLVLPHAVLCQVHVRGVVVQLLLVLRHLLHHLRNVLDRGRVLAADALLVGKALESRSYLPATKSKGSIDECNFRGQSPSCSQRARIGSTFC